MKPIAATRRRFLAFLGGAAAAGPSAAQATIKSLDIGAIGVRLPDGSGSGPVGTTASMPSDYARSRLDQIIRMQPAAVDRARREFQPDCMDPDTAALRSVSLVRKLQRTRDIQFARHHQERKTYWQGVVDGLWDD